MGENETGYLLMLGAYRDNEVFPTHPLIVTLSELEKQEALISTITLLPLSEIYVNQLVADTLSCDVELAQPLTELVTRKTKGNPFFITQFLKGLHEDGLIAFDRDVGHWQCDLVKVRDAALTDDVVEFMVRRLYKLPAAAQEIMKLAACIGNQFSLDTLVIIVGDRALETVAADLWHLLRAGLILPLSKTYKFFQEESASEADLEAAGEQRYRFLHDRVQQAAYTLIPEDEKTTVHLAIGRLLLRHTPPEQKADNLFEITNQLNKGLPLITDVSERQELTQLNLEAGCKARTATAYQAADNYFSTSLELLPADAWDNQYDLTLTLTEKAVESAFLQYDYATMATRIEAIKQNSRSVFDCIEVYNIEIIALYAQGQYNESMDQGLAFLKELGLELPYQATLDDIQGMIVKVETALGDRAIADLVDLPTMADRRSLACVKLLSSLGPTTYTVPRNLTPIVLGHMVRLSMEQGNAPESAYGYALYGLMVDSLTQDIHTAYAFGQLSLALQEKYQNDELAAKVILLANSISHWFESLRSADPRFKSAYPIALAVGDFYFAASSFQAQSANALYYGESLDVTSEATAATQAACAHYNDTHGVVTANIYHQTVCNLLGQSDDPRYLQGDHFDSVTWLEEQEAGTEETGNVFFVGSFEMWLCYLFSDFSGALKNVKLAHQYLHVMPGIQSTPFLFFYDSLTRCAHYGEASESDQADHLKAIAANQEKMKYWSETGPMNYLHKYQLVEAERARIRGDRLTAMDYYDQAILGAKTNQFLHEEALANELAAKYYLGLGREKIASAYMQEAYYCYARWVAKAKTDHLKATYPQLLAPILQKQRVEFNTIETLNSFTQAQTTSASSHTSRTHSSSSKVSDALDLASILQAAQKLASTIDLEQLLGEIAEIILTNAGAQKMALLTPHQSKWQLQASAERGSDGTIMTQTQTAPNFLTPDSPVPIRLIQYVKNTQKPVLISESKTEITGILEGYLLRYQPQSVLCVPLLNQGNLVAIAYLEHPTTKGIFSSDRQIIIEFLCAQAAVALRNAQLYRQAQAALEDLQEAQLQLVQNEKMSALGNLVAGVAHEINNPMGFLEGNIKPAKDYVQDLLGLIDIYQSEYPQPNTAIDEEIDAIELDFLREDLPKLIGSMRAGVDRVRNISNSLRIFSRKDQDHKTAFNLHDGIDSTLLILKHRTKAHGNRPSIKILKNYGDLPEVQCFPGQLNQVFMNLLANAIDAFDEANKGKTYEEIEANPNIITLQTSVIDKDVEIQIQDNGCGMKQETAARIFEQGFTTKEVGKGTGLGLAIARQIVVDTHGGTLKVESEIGKGTQFRINLPMV